MRFEIRHDLPRGADEAFALLTSPDFTRRLDEHLGLEKTLLEEEVTPAGWRRAWRIVDRGDKPAFVERLVGSIFEYRLEQQMEQGPRRIAWRVVPALGADRVKASGSETIEPGARSAVSRRVVVGSVVVDVPLVGRRLAGFIGGEVRQGYQRTQPLIEDYLRSAGSP